MKIADLTLYGSNAPLSTASPLPTAVEHASVAGYEYTAPQQVNAFTSGYENILDMGFLSGMDTFPDMSSLFGSDAPIPGAGSQWASNHSDEYGEVIDEPAATGTGSTETTGNTVSVSSVTMTTNENGEVETVVTTTEISTNQERPGEEVNRETADNRQRVPTADEIKALLSRIEQGTVTARDVADRFETDENGNEWAVINGQRVSPDAVITGAAVPVDSNGQPAGQPIYSMVLSESITEPTSAELSAMFGSDEPLYEGSITLSELNPDWDFGAGTAEDNQKYIGPTIKQLFQALYHTQPTDEQVNNLTLIVTAYALNAPAEDYGNNLANLCQNVVQAYGTGDLTSDPLSGMVPVHVLMNSSEQQTNTSQPQTPVPSNSQQTANSGNNASTTSSVPPVPDYNYGAINPYGTFSSEAEAAASANTSAEALKKAQDKINAITAETLKDKYEKYKKQIDAATRGMNESHPNYETKKMFTTLVAVLKDIANENRNKLSASDKSKLVSAISRKLVEIMKTKTIYDANSGARPFDDKGNFIAPMDTVCSKFVAIIAYIMGASKQGNSTWTSAHNSFFYLSGTENYEYANSYVPVDKEIGVTNQAYNATIFKQPGINQETFNEYFKNPEKYVNELRQLEGQAVFWRYDASNSQGLSSKYISYQHTLILGPYDPVTKTFTIYESNENKVKDSVTGQMIRKPDDGIRDRSISIASLKNANYLKIVEFNI